MDKDVNKNEPLVCINDNASIKKGDQNLQVPQKKRFSEFVYKVENRSNAGGELKFLEDIKSNRFNSQMLTKSVDSVPKSHIMHRDFDHKPTDVPLSKYHNKNLISIKESKKEKDSGEHKVINVIKPIPLQYQSERNTPKINIKTTDRNNSIINQESNRPFLDHPSHFDQDQSVNCDKHSFMIDANSSLNESNMPLDLGHTARNDVSHFILQNNINNLETPSIQDVSPKKLKVKNNKDKILHVKNKGNKVSN